MSNRTAFDALLNFPVERISDRRLHDLLTSLALAITSTNDPTTLRALGQSLKLMGDYARSEAYAVTKDCW